MGIAGDRSSDSIKDYHRTVPGHTGSNVNFFLFAINFVLCVGLEEVRLSNLLKPKCYVFDFRRWFSWPLNTIFVSYEILCLIVMKYYICEPRGLSSFRSLCKGKHLSKHLGEKSLVLGSILRIVIQRYSCSRNLKILLVFRSVCTIYASNK